MASWLKSWGGLVEALILAAVGGYMVFFALGPDYWQLINPKFKWLTISAGAGLWICGLVAAYFSGKSSGSPTRIILFLVLGLCFMVQDNMPALGTGFEQNASLAQPAPEEDPQAPRLTHEGREYVKINLGELIFLAENQPAQTLAGRWAFRGMVRRSPALDQLKCITLLRTMIFCCLADGVAVGLVVPVDDPNEYHNGQWLRACGVLEKPASPCPQAASVKMPGVFLTTVAEDLLFKADELRPIPPPSMPYMFEFSQKEPYFY